MSQIKVVAVDFSFSPETMPVYRVLGYCGSYPLLDKSRKPIYLEPFFDPDKSILEANQKRYRKAVKKGFIRSFKEFMK